MLIFLALCWLFGYISSKNLTMSEIVKCLALALIIGAPIGGLTMWLVVVTFFTSCIVPCTGLGFPVIAGLDYYVFMILAGVIVGAIVVLIMGINRYEKVEMPIVSLH